MRRILLAGLIFFALAQTTRAQSGSALHFDGVDDIVSIPDKAIPVLNMTSTFTIEAWIYPTNSSTSVQDVVSKSNNVNNNAFIFPRTDDGWANFELFLNLEGQGWQIISAPYASINQWHHVAATYDGQYMKLYMDGVLANTMYAPGTVTTNSNPLFIGQQPGYDEAFQGSVDELRIWNRVLSECEIRNSMFCEFNAPQTGLAAYYQFNEGVPGGNNTSLTSVTDNSGNGLNGTLSNFSLTGSSSNWITGKASGACTAYTPPVPVIGSNGTAFVVGSTINLTASGGSSYAWTGPNGFTSTQQNPSIVNAQTNASGIYTVYVTRGGCTESASIVISVQQQAGGLHFDGVNDQVNITHSASLDIRNTITLEAWIKPTDSVRQIQDVMGKSSLSNNNSYIFPRTQDGWRSFSFVLKLEGQTDWTELTAPYPGVGANKWHHVAASYDGSFMRIFLDGALAAEKQVSGTITGNTNMLVLGQQPGFVEYYTGSVDEIRVWNRALTQCEISNNMNCELGGTPLGLAAYYKFNQGLPDVDNSAVTTLTDASGNNNTGTLTNFALTGLTSNWIPGKVSGTCAAFTPMIPTIGSSGALIAVGTVLNLTASGGTSYSWTGPNGFSSTLQNPSIANVQVAASGIYTVTVSNGTCSLQASTKVVVAVPAKGLSFDGINDRIVVPDDPSLSVTSAISIESWIYATDQNRAIQDVMGKSSLSDNTSYIFPRTDDGWNTFIFYLNIAGKGWVTVTAPYNGLNQWHHVAATYDGAYMRLFLDGVQVGSRPMTGAIVMNNNPLTIGNQPGYDEYFRGTVDELRLWNRALSSCEINNNMNCETDPSIQNGLVAYYRFNQGFVGIDNSTITTSLTDVTGNNHSGTFSGFEFTGSVSNWVTGKVSGNCAAYVPIVPVINSNGPVIPVGGTIQLSASGGDSYTWSGPNGFASTLQSPNVVNAQLNASGKYKVYVTARNCTDTTSTSITVKPLPVITPNGPATFCPSGSVTLTSSVALTYQWYLNGNIISGAVNRTYLANNGGNYTVAVTDNGNYAATSLPFAVAVVDNQAPVPNVAQLPAITGDYPLAVINKPTATDNCAGTITASTTDPLLYQVAGTYTIHWVYNDGNGNTVTQNQQVTVTTPPDNIPPVLAVPANITQSNDVNVCGAIVNFAATATDNIPVPVTITYSQNPGTSFPVGATTVTVTAKDAAGNISQKSFVVTVNDTQLPVITAPANQHITLPVGVTSIIPVLGTPVASDNCGFTVTNNAPASFNVGTTLVTWTVKDNSGNTATATQTITVQATPVDNVPPVLTIPSDIVKSNDPNACGAVVNFTASATDNFPGVVTVTYSKNPGTSFPIGVTTVTVTATDLAGNSTQRNFTVTVNDTQRPVITAPANRTVTLPAGAATIAVSLGTPTASDNCGYTVTNDAPSAFTAGNTTVTWTVRDNSGNTATATQVITVQVVATDNIPPVITPVPNQSFCVSSNGTYTIPAISATDNVGVTSVTFIITGATNRNSTGTNAVNASGAFAAGTSTITWKVSDAKGNTSTSSTVVKVTAAPVASITASTGDPFAGCSIVTLTAACNGTPASYKWLSANGTTICTSQTLDLRQSDSEGVYKVQVTDANGCASVATTSYSFQKQNLAKSYTILAYDEVELGKSSVVASGSVGIMSSRGEVEFKKNSSVASPGSFVKSPSIDKSGSGIRILNPVCGVATVSLPAMFSNNTSTKRLPNKDVAKNTTVTLNDNYNNLSIKKGANVVVTGNTFGAIKLEEGARIRFTNPVLYIDQLVVDKGSQNDYAYVRFAPNTKVMVNTEVKIGRRVIINPDNYVVTFYMGDSDCDDGKFSVQGSDTKVFANIFMPSGKLTTNSDDSDDDDDCNYYDWWWDCDYWSSQYSVYGCSSGNGNDNQSVSGVQMTGLFIVEELKSQNTTWNGYNCNGPAIAVNNVTNTTTVTTEEQPAGKLKTTSEGELKVTVMPNPTTTYFTLRVESKYETPVNIRITDASGRVVDVKNGVNANGNIQVGHNYNSGTYFAEIMQGTQRKVIQLIKVRY